MIDKEKLLKHLDTMDRFHEDIDELENDIKQGKFDTKLGTCRWKEDDGFEDNGLYETSCDNIHQFIEGNVNQNSYSYCPYCGKPIEEFDNA